LKNYEPASSFGRDVAEQDARRGDEAEAVAFLAERAGAGPALELAIGTGRIALPLAARGIRVDGIDISPAMVEQLRSKPGGERLSVSMGDFADVAVPGSYSLIYVVWNSFFNLLTQDDQLRSGCFARSDIPLSTRMVLSLMP
jgi:ubiquinone/menaquinone biosynthesis C-methylase UbiE